MTQQALTQLNTKLREQGMSPIANWANYRKAYLERSHRARTAKDKRGKAQDAKAVFIS